jgi:hypothetical protein
MLLRLERLGSVHATLLVEHDMDAVIPRSEPNRGDSQRHADRKRRD